MQTMLFAAGKGTRLKPLTDIIPKALVPIADKPLLQIVTERLAAAGADSVVVNVHHHVGDAASNNVFDYTLKHRHPVEWHQCFGHGVGEWFQSGA